jgi:phosphoribosylformylglycinamidine synthase
MKTYRVVVHIMPHPEILDPKGKATEQGLHSLGFQTVQAVRIGKRISFQLQAASEQQAEELAHSACQKLLVNAIMEGYTLELQSVE